MSTHKPSADAYLRWIVANEYYDGAMAGVGERVLDGAAVWFRVVAWDAELWQRVFAVTVVDSDLVQQLIQDLEGIEHRRSPFWLPGPATATRALNKVWNGIEDSALRSERWWLIEGHDLLASNERQVTPTDAAMLVASIRAGTVLDVSGPSMIDSLLRHIRSQSR